MDPPRVRTSAGSLPQIACVVRYSLVLTAPQNLSLASPAQRPLASKPRLVLAEDEPSLCQFLHELLEGQYAVEPAMDGEQAWDAIQQARPDVVLLNVQMPVLDGLGLVRRMRGSSTTATVPILLLSGQLNGSAVEEALAAGANGWLQKPFCLGELFSKLRALEPTG